MPKLQESYRNTMEKKKNMLYSIISRINQRQGNPMATNRGQKVKFIAMLHNRKISCH